MTPYLAFAADHPVLAVLLVVVTGWAASIVAAAPWEAVGRHRRHPLDCPRCRGTGRDPK